MSRLAALCVVALAIAGCAVPVPAPRPVPAPPSPQAPASPPVVVRTGAGPAAPDSTPSPEALAVLATIPEPLGGATTAPAPPAAYDSLRSSPSDRDVPVPARTQPLLPPGPLPAAPPPPSDAPAAAPTVAAPPDTCWRVQVAAPADREKGKSVRDAAESLLMIPMIVDREGGRFKVRTRDCLSREAAASLRDRATASGFKGVFLVRVSGAR
ncbi:MAG: hypothetical protein IT347_09315 [Candidatus Eisenbacteria bacterium]|nr:hypothetical protein [Candidatus Eisenbacteria bacterium]